MSYPATSALPAPDSAREGEGKKIPRMKLVLWSLATLVIMAAGVYLSIEVWSGDDSVKEDLTAFLQEARGSAWALPIVVGCYIAAGFVFFPIALLNLVIAMVFGLWGIVYGLVGVMANTLFFYGIGLVIKRYGAQKWMQHPKIKPVDEKIRKSGLAGMVALHALPAPPFSILNIVAGISSVGTLLWLLGTFLAMLPGAISRGVLGEGLTQLLIDPKPESIAYVLGGVALWIALVGGAHFLLKKFEKKETRQA